MDNNEPKAKPGQKTFFSGISKNVISMGLTSFLTDTSTELSYPLLPVFLKTILGVGPRFIGIIEGIAETTASLLKLISGWLSDKLNRRKAIVIGGYGLSGLTRPLIAISYAGWHVLGARFLDRVGKGFRTSARDALIADSTSPEYRGKAFGFHRAMDNAGAVLGPLLAFIIISIMISGSGIFGELFSRPIEILTRMENTPLDARNFRIIFWLSSIPAILSVIVLIFFVKEVRKAGEPSKLPILTIKPFDRYFNIFLPIIILFTLGNSSDAFLILRAKDFGVATVFVPILWIILNTVKMLSSIPGGAWSDKVGRRKGILAGWTVYSLIYLGFAFARSQWHIWVLFALYGIYFGLTEGTEKAFVADLVPSELRATAYGVYNFSIGIAALPSSLIMGHLYQTYNATVAFGFGAGVSILAMILLFLMIPANISQRKKS
ncbi:MFS transporter [Candidatus Poribacteria bacterium]|nr:MFS transporter [Candidatus Poribacteria bacterium]